MYKKLFVLQYCSVGYLVRWVHMPTRRFCISRNQLRLLYGSGIRVQTAVAVILEDWLCWPGYGHATDIKQIAFQRKQDGGLFSSGRPAALFVTATCNGRVYLGDLAAFRGRNRFNIFVVFAGCARHRPRPVGFPERSGFLSCRRVRGRWRKEKSAAVRNKGR